MDINVPAYSGSGMQFVWEDGFTIKATINVVRNTICIEANSSGLVSLARHLLMLAQKDVPNNAHFHLDEFNSLEDGSAEIVVVKNQNI